MCWRASKLPALRAGHAPPFHLDIDLRIRLVARATSGSTNFFSGTRTQGPSGEAHITSSIFLHTRDARRIALGSKTRTSNIGGMLGALIQSMPLKNEAEQIATFIGVPMEVFEGTQLGARAR